MFGLSIRSGHILLVDVPRYFGKPDMTQDEVSERVELFLEMANEAEILLEGVSLHDRVMHVCLEKLEDAKFMLHAFQKAREQTIAEMEAVLSEMHKAMDNDLPF